MSTSKWPSLELEQLLFMLSSSKDAAKREHALAAITLSLHKEALSRHLYHPATLRRVCGVLKERHAEVVEKREEQRPEERRLEEFRQSLHEEHLYLEQPREGESLSLHAKACITSAALCLQDHLTEHGWNDLLWKLWGIREDVPVDPTLWSQRHQPATWEPLLSHSKLALARALMLDNIYRHYYTTVLLLDEGDDSDLALPFPIRVDVAEGNGNLEPRILNSDGIEIETDFAMSLRRAAEAARQAWLAKHGSYPAEMKRRVSNCDIVFNFEMGANVMSGLMRQEMLSSRPKLSEQSATLPLALAALSRLLGRHFDDRVLASGPLVRITQPFAEDTLHNSGSRRPANTRDFEAAWKFKDEETGERVIGTKLNLARTLAVYERLIFPADTPRSAIRKVIPQTCEGDHSRREVLAIHPVTTPLLSVAADAWLPSGWRQSRYVRLPELAALHENSCIEWQTKELPSDAAFLQAFTLGRCLNIYHSTPETSKALVHALLRSRQRLFEHGVPLMRTLHLRCASTPNPERHRQFWQIVLEGIHATASDIAAFDRAGSWDGRADVVAGMLNSFEPTWTNRERFGPNLIIITQLDMYRTDRGKDHAPSKLLSHPWEIWLRVANRLGPSSHEAHEQLFGPTRLILETEEAIPDASVALQQDGICHYDAGRLDIRPFTSATRQDIERLFGRLGPALAEALTRLAVFRWDFTTAGAVAVFGADAVDDRPAKSLIRLLGLAPAEGPMPTPARADLRHMFSQLCKENVLVEAQGKYHIPIGLRDTLQGMLAELVRRRSQNLGDEELHFLANLDLAAARHYLPLLAPLEFPTTLTCESLRAESLFEADFHLVRSQAERPASVQTSNEKQVRRALVRFFFPPGVREWPLREVGLWDEARMAQVTWFQALKCKAPHPRWFYLCIESSVGAIEIDRTDNEERRSRIRDVMAEFDYCLALFKNPDLEFPVDELIWDESYIEAKLSTFLFCEAPQDSQAVARGLALVDGLLRKTGLRSMPGDTFERAADVILFGASTTIDDAARSRALGYYESAMRHAPNYGQPFAKAAALMLERGDERSARHTLGQLDDRLWQAVVADAERRLRHGAPSEPISWALRNYQIPAIAYALSRKILPSTP